MLVDFLRLFLLNSHMHLQQRIDCENSGMRNQ